MSQIKGMSVFICSEVRHQETIQLLQEAWCLSALVIKFRSDCQCQWYDVICLFFSLDDQNVSNR